MCAEDEIYEVEERMQTIHDHHSRIRARARLRASLSIFDQAFLQKGPH
jgi:hypothetical protein